MYSDKTMAELSRNRGSKPTGGRFIVHNLHVMKEACWV